MGSFSKTAWWVIALVVLAMTWLAAKANQHPRWFGLWGAQGDYYNLEVAGFRSGHTYLAAEVSPDLLSPDPEVRRRAPFLLDATLYRGRYYLYYGVVPAVALFLPYNLLTGQSLSLNAATVILVILGFLASAATYARARSRYFPRASRAFDVVALLLLAFAPVTPSLLVRASFYEVPIAGAYACAMASAWAIFRALHAPRSAAAWLAGASLFLGLAVGCRPNFIFALPALPVVAGGLHVWRVRSSRKRADRAWTLLGAMLVPGAVVGAGLGMFNYLRFGDMLEFGFKYGMNAFFSTGMPLASARFLVPNLTWYYFTPPALSPYFPYVFPIGTAPVPAGYYSNEAIHGQVLLLPVAILGLLSLLRVWRKQGVDRRLSVFLGMLLWMGLTSLVFLCALGVRANRYMTDFQAPFLLALVVATGVGLADRAGSGRWEKTVQRAAALCAFLLAGFNVLAALELFNCFPAQHPVAFERLARLGSHLSSGLYRLGLQTYGPIKFRVTFVPKSAVAIEPLVVAGLPGSTDALQVVQHPDRTIELSLLHEGFGGPGSASLPIEYGRSYEVELECGAFYPPRRNPFFDHWPERSVELVKTTAVVRFDGKEVIRSRMKAYDAPPASISLGGSRAFGPGRFSGQISALERQPPKSAETAARDGASGLWRMQVSFKYPATMREPQPLLGSGVTGAGNLLFMDHVPNGPWRLGIDFWGRGAVYSPSLEIDPEATYTLEIFAGSQAVPQAVALGWFDETSLHAAATTFAVWLNGKCVWRTPILAHVDSYDFATPARNQQGFNTTPADFSGPWEMRPFSENEARDFLRKNQEEIAKNANR